MNTIIDQFFNGSLSDIIGSDFVSQSPSVNIAETDQSFIIHLAAPGLNKEAFDLELKDDHLIIKVEKKTEEAAKDIKYMRREWSYDSFNRRFYLPKTIDRDKISGTYVDGILSVTLLKKEEAKAKEPKSIVIK